jgi:hypothetical protein
MGCFLLKCFNNISSLDALGTWQSSCITTLFSCHPMIGENRQQLVSDEPVKFKKSPVEVQDCRKITDHFRGKCRIYSNLIKED